MRVQLSSMAAAVAISSALGLGLADAQSKVNFTGTWKMNPAKSDFGRGAGLTSRLDRISHNDPNLNDTIISQTIEQGEITSTMSYTTDGRESTNYPIGIEYKSSARWVGDELVIESRSPARGQANLKDRWSLSPDGQTLTIRRHASAGLAGSADLKIVFDRQTAPAQTDLDHPQMAAKPAALDDKLQASQQAKPDNTQAGDKPAAQRVTVELKTGERIEGTFEQATPAATVIDVGGQSITIPADKIQAMSFGATVARPSAGPGPFQEAIDELNGLRSVTGSGISYLEYSRRVLDAEVKVDRYLSSAADSPLRSAISLAMREYELASQEWNEAIHQTYRVHETLLRYIDGRMLSEDSKCPAFSQWHDLVRQNFTRNWYIRSFAVDGLISRYQAVLWTCATDQLAEAQRLSKAR